jgi:glycosyltransferase involved in cell wall biosynthesis
MKLSVVIPAYNEAGTIEQALRAVGRALPTVPKQIIVVDDGSTDGTREWLRAQSAPGSALRSDLGPQVELEVIFHEQNRGKGGAVRTGFAHCRGDVVIIQDADLEYDPEDWRPMWNLVVERSVADVVYGSRFYGNPHRSLNFHHFLGNKLISWMFNVLFNQTLTDIEVCYKMMRIEVLRSFDLRCEDFGIEVELTARIARSRRWRIYEVGVSYFGRTYAEGKKINWRDGVKALLYIVMLRFGW